METELTKIEKRISEMEFVGQNSIASLISNVDKIYIILDEKNHINLFNERLCALKSTLAIAESHEEERKEVFESSKLELLGLLKETAEIV